MKFFQIRCENHIGMYGNYFNYEFCLSRMREHYDDYIVDLKPDIRCNIERQSFFILKTEAHIIKDLSK